MIRKILGDISNRVRLYSHLMEVPSSPMTGQPFGFFFAQKIQKGRVALLLLLFTFLGTTTLQAQPPMAPFGIWDWITDLVEEPNYYEEKNASLQLGIGFVSDINVAEQASRQDQFDVKMLTPGLSLTFERQIWNNIGLGLTIANQNWKDRDFNYQYQYFVGGVRVAYHLNVADKFDPYIGGAVTYRRMHLTNSEFNVFNKKITGSILLGTRYYFKERWAGFFEIGDDALSFFKAGITFYIP